MKKITKEDADILQMDACNIVACELINGLYSGNFYLFDSIDEIKNSDNLNIFRYCKNDVNIIS